MATETLPLAAPEVEAGQEVDAATDQYALAAILVKATSGRAPTRGEELPSEVPDHWLPALRRALNPDPAARWGSVRELAEALEPGRRRDAGLWTGATAGPDDFPILLPPPFEKEGGEGEGGEREGGDGEDGEGEQPWPSGPEPLRAGASWRRVAGAVLLLLMASAVAPAYVSDLGARMADLADAQVEEWGGMGAITERWRRSGAAELAAVLFEGRAAPAARLPTSAARERELEPQEPPPSSERQQAEPRRDPEPEPEVPAAPGAASGTAASWDPSPSATAYSDTEARPTGLGLLEVHSDPWASVFIDDVFVGNTPLLDVRIPAGDHVLRIERSRFDPHIRVITMEPGQELRLMDIVLTGGGR